MLGEEGITEQSKVKLQDYNRDTKCFSESPCLKKLLRTFRKRVVFITQRD